jgi:hypothetical protein
MKTLGMIFRLAKIGWIRVIEKPNPLPARRQRPNLNLVLNRNRSTKQIKITMTIRIKTPPARNPLANAPQFCMFTPVAGLTLCAVCAGRLWNLNR